MSVSDFVLEICVDNLESVRNAISGGAKRLELCSALSEGGLTPSFGFVKHAKKIAPIPVFAMIRIRCGDFLYERDEMDAMLDDVKVLKDLDIDGFVFGALTKNNEIHVDYCREIINAASPLSVTFHRAFDEVSDPVNSLQILRDLGFNRILTSGQKKTAVEGLPLIRTLVDVAKDAIVVMPGAGITEKNISIIKEASTTKEFHASAKMLKDMTKSRIDQGRVYVTCKESVRLMVDSLQLNP